MQEQLKSILIQRVKKEDYFIGFSIFVDRSKEIKDLEDIDGIIHKFSK